MPVLTKLDPAKPVTAGRKRVAAYCRVSRDSERLLHSYASQVSYYSGFIQSNPGWEYAGVYADEAISGTNMEIRSEFNRMLRDCDAGKIDIILVKSISRFARNTVDMLKTVRHLRLIGVEVRFEEQRINTLSEAGELMLTILAAFAEQESVTQSANIRWAKDMTASAGKMTNGSVPYGYRFDNGLRIPVICPEEAAIVRMIFEDYLSGLSVYEIADRLNALEIPSHRGKHWQQCTIRKMLSNITYTGNMLLGKTYVDDPLTHNRVVNEGIMPRYYVEESHESIISMETFDRAQAELERRSRLGRLANNHITVNHYTGKIICKGCGRPFGRMNYRMAGGTREICWSCKKPGGKCATPGILEKEMDAIVTQALGTNSFDPVVFESETDRIEVGLDDLVSVILKNGRVFNYQFTRRKKSPQKHGGK